MKKHTKTIIFDMDGTLIDSGNVIANTINFVRENFGLEKMQKNHILKCINNPKLNSSMFFYNTPTFTAKHTKLFEDYYEEHCISDIILYDGILELLEELANNYNMTIATNANSSFAKQMTKHLDIEDYFDDIVGANDVVSPKPKPDMLQLLIDRNQYKKDLTLMVGDSHKDIMSANNANIKSLLVNWGFSNYTKEDKAIQTVEELQRAILIWGETL